jgi:hypothetical protein
LQWHGICQAKAMLISPGVFLKASEWPAKQSCHLKDYRLYIMDVFMKTSSAKTTAFPIPYMADRENLILKHLPQIRCVALKICSKLPAYIDANDLIGDGVLGLSDAVEKYDPARGVRFKTYSQYRIRGAILDMAEIGHCLNLNGSRILQIHSRAMMKIRTRLCALAAPDNCEEHTESGYADYN